MQRAHEVDDCGRVHRSVGVELRDDDLGNGARLERLNFLAHASERGLAQSHGLMVNYLYDLEHIEKNHEAYENEGLVAASRQVHGLLKTERGRAEPGRFLQLSGLRSSRSGQVKEESE